MVKLAWKVINGYGPYAYLQESVWMGDGKVVSKHVAYLGAFGKTAVPGKTLDWEGQAVEVPAVPDELIEQLKSEKAKAKASGKVLPFTAASTSPAAAPSQIAPPADLGAIKKVPLEAVPAPKLSAVKSPELGPMPAAVEKAVAQAPKDLKPVAVDFAHAAVASVEAVKAQAAGAVEELGPDKKAEVAQLAQAIAKAAGAQPGQVKAELNQAAIDPGAFTPKIKQILKDAADKPLLSKSAVKIIEAAAAKGPQDLEAGFQHMKKAYKDPNKFSALYLAKIELEEQLKQGKPTIESATSSGMPDAFAAAAAGEIKMPAQPKPSSAVVNNQEQAIATGKKDWDADLEQVEGKKGTNEGGLFKDKKLNSLHYVKWPGEMRARAEVLAGRLYSLAEVPVARTNLIEVKGKPAVSSDWIKDAKPMTAAEMRKNADVRNGFLVDAWLANWDAVGMQHDNIVMTDSGKAFRIDVGGALTFRARGKPKNFTAEVQELETMRNPATAPQASKVFDGLKVQELKEQATKIGLIPDQAIDDAVDSAGIPAKEHPDFPVSVLGAEAKNPNVFLKKRLKERRAWLVKEVGTLQEPKEWTEAELAQLTGLSPKAAKEILDAVGNFKISTSAENRREPVEKAMKLQLGAKEGGRSYQAVHQNFRRWKGSANNTEGQFSRLAAAEAKGFRDLEDATQKAFWKFSGHSVDGQLAARQQLEDKWGKSAVAGFKVTSQINSVVARQQNNLPEGGKIVLYRGWKPDQVKFLQWNKLSVGDEVDMGIPTMLSYSYSPHTAQNFGSGSIVTKTKLDPDDIIVSDRVNNHSGTFIGEEEVLWVNPKAVQEVIYKS